MSQIEVVERYFAAWNAHDALMLQSLFTPDGSYCNTGMKQALRGPAIASHALHLWNAFPDFYLSRRATMTSCEGDVAAQWILHGTHEGSLMGLPPAGYTISLPGLDLIAVKGESIRSVRSYFDSRNLFEQLGMQVSIQSPLSQYVNSPSQKLFCGEIDGAGGLYGKPCLQETQLGEAYLMHMMELGRAAR